MTQSTPRTALPNASRLSLGLAVLRVAVGAVFLMHGAQKLFTFGIAGTTGAFAQMGAPLPEITAPLIAVLELAGGAALILGLLTPLVAALLALDMLVATVLVHLPAGFFAADGGYELTLTLFAASLALALTGPGAYALDTLVRRRRA